MCVYVCMCVCGGISKEEGKGRVREERRGGRRTYVAILESSGSGDEVVARLLWPYNGEEFFNWRDVDIDQGEIFYMCICKYEERFRKFQTEIL